MTAGPLILVTRPAGDADPLVKLLRARGHRVAAVPTVITRLAEPGGALDDALRGPVTWRWIVVTSPSGAAAVGEALRRVDREAATLLGTHWAAVGPATAAALAAIGVVADLVPDESTGLGIARALRTCADAAGLRGTRILLPRADAASPDLPEALRAAGADLVEAVAYRTVEAPAESAPAAVAALLDPDLAVIVVASGSAVRGLLRLALDAGLAERVVGTPLVAIGPTTAAVARGRGLTLVHQAARPAAEALAQAVDAALLSRQPSQSLSVPRRP